MSSCLAEYSEVETLPDVLVIKVPLNVELLGPERITDAIRIVGDIATRLAEDAAMDLFYSKRRKGRADR